MVAESIVKKAEAAAGTSPVIPENIEKMLHR